MTEIKKVDENNLKKLREYSLATLLRVQELGSVGNPQLTWPEFIEDYQRIDYNNRKYKHTPIIDLYKEVYNVVLNEHEEHLEETSNIDVGDIIELNILSIDKKGVVFDQSNIKENIQCNVKLNQYPNLVEHAFDRPLNFKVISKTNNTIIVDPFASMLDEWLEKHTKNLELQNDVEGENYIEVQDLQLTRGGYLGKIRIDTISEMFGKDVYMKAFIPGSQIVLNIEYDFNRWVGKNIRAHIVNYSNDSKYGSIIICSAKEYLTLLGSINMIYLFNQELEYLKNSKEDPNLKNPVTSKIYKGRVTGICHTSKKCGVFIELPNLNITGMVECSPESLNTYKRGSDIEVVIYKFDRKNPRKRPYEISDDIITNNNLRIVFKEI